LPAAYQLQAAGKGKEQPKKTAISSMKQGLLRRPEVGD